MQTVLPSKQGVSTLGIVCSLSPVLQQKQKSQFLSFRTGLVCRGFSRLLSVPAGGLYNGVSVLPMLVFSPLKGSSASGWPLLFVWRQGWSVTRQARSFMVRLQPAPPLLLPLLPAFLAPGTYNTCGCTNTFWWLMALRLCLPCSGCWDVLSPFPFLTRWY